MTDDKPALKSQECVIHAPIEAIYRAFVEAAMLREWLGLDLDLVLELGGKYVLEREGVPLLDGSIGVLAWPEALAVSAGEQSFELKLVADFGATTAHVSSRGMACFDGALERLEAYMTRAGRR